ncbi:MAG TPA: phosphoribosyltransferase family protein [Candidatus Bathyarchaeia archaeon]|nr:phosphoribosyltransferase family protein [Candidatus Bathyarchaeia archaeon]
MILNKSTVDSKPGIKSLPKEYCTWQEVEVLVEKLADKIQRLGKKYDAILAITNGGIVPARLIARELNIDDIQFIPIRNKKLFKNEMRPLLKGKKYLIIDEIYDTGNTFSKVLDSLKEYECDFAFLMNRYKNNNARVVAKILNHGKYVVFPWERKDH